MQMVVMASVRRFALIVAVAAVWSGSAALAASPVCPAPSLGDAVVGMQDFSRTSDSPPLATVDWIGVVEGDEHALLETLNHVHRKKGSYVALLFYASWCPFSKACRPNFQMLSSLFPSIRHFAFEESVIRPRYVTYWLIVRFAAFMHMMAILTDCLISGSILSRYGVLGFPTLFLLNSTIIVRYQGPRTINALAEFYYNVAGVNPASLDPMYVEAMIGSYDDLELEEGALEENCPFSWARSQEKLLQQDTYLVLACCFLLIRLLYFLLPKLNSCLSQHWSRQNRYANLGNLWDYLQARIEQIKCSFSRLYPCKRSNLQEGATNATVWASKSLASVSLGEPSTGRTYTRSQR